MFFLWRNKPASVLSCSGDWIPKQEVRKRLNEVRIFANAGEARHVQRSKYSKRGVSVLGEKVFKDKTKVEKLPVCKEAISQDENNGAPDKLVTYNEYLDILCEGDDGHNNRVIFPSANKEQTTQTPLIQDIKGMLAKLADFLANLEAYERRLSSEIRQIDLLVSDRLHQVELFELSDEESIVFVKALREAQIERRRRKNELFALMSCKELLQQATLPNVKRTIHEIEGLGQQKYRCKVLTENDPFVQEHVIR